MTRHETDISSELLRERSASSHLAPLTGKGWLASVDPEIAARILEIGRIRNLRAGDPLFHVGDGDGGLFGVVSGGVLVWLPGPEATMLPAHVMRAGGWIGTGPLMTRRRRILTTHAAEDSECLYLPLSRLNGLISEDAAVAGAIAQLSSFTTDTCIECTSDLLIRSSEQRIAAVLLRITTTAAADVTPSDPRGFVLSHTLIAQLSNASRDTVSRTLSKFRESGWIGAGYGLLVIRDVDALKRVATGLARTHDAGDASAGGEAVALPTRATKEQTVSPLRAGLATTVEMAYGEDQGDFGGHVRGGDPRARSGDRDTPIGGIANHRPVTAKSRLRAGLNTHVWFSRQGARLQEALLSVARVVAVERDEEILGRTETEQRLVGVLSGSALVSIEGLDGEMHPLHAVRGGTWLASRPDPGQVHRGFVAKALEPSSFVVIRMSDIAAEVQRDPVLAKDIASILDYTQDLLIACGVDLLIRETDRRVGAVLLRLSGMASIEEGLATPRTIALPQRLIGQIANASRDSVNRVLAGFAARSWITVDYGRIEVTNPEGLRRFANGG